jgi:hypothetical protein
MSTDVWREDVAQLLESCAASLRAHKDYKGAADLGAALAYLQRAEDEGEKGATLLLAQVTATPSLDKTERFTFAPGELETLAGKK